MILIVNKGFKLICSNCGIIIDVDNKVNRQIKITNTKESEIQIRCQECDNETIINNKTYKRANVPLADVGMSNRSRLLKEKNEMILNRRSLI